MPGYGVPEKLEGALPWSWAEERLVKCRNYFVATTRPDGRPHVMPVWGLWISDRNLFGFSTSIKSIKSQNLLANPVCAITIEDGHNTVILEGAARLTDLEELPDFLKTYAKKYYGREDADTGPVESPIWTVKPTVAFAFNEDETFSTSATRWEF
jgi:hypothetical protein